MLAGPLAGKQFVVYKHPTLIGSSPHCDIYLFKEPQAGAEHARLNRIGRAYEIEDLSTRSATVVNGVAVQKRILRDGDRITIGATLLEYRSRGT
jgi:pSer/pThr/pTyr-binding forkhead associated (FHA) protein